MKTISHPCFTDQEPVLCEDQIENFDRMQPQAFSEDWAGYTEVEGDDPEEEVECTLLLGADDNATFSVDGHTLSLEPRGPEGGGSYEEKQTSFRLKPGWYYVSVTYQNINYSKPQNNRAALKTLLNGKIPELYELPGKGKEKECDCEEGSCDGDGGGGGTSAKMLRGNDGADQPGFTSSSAGNASSTADHRYMAWEATFGVFRGMQGLPGGRIELLHEQFGPEMWDPSSLLYRNIAESELILSAGAVVPNSYMMIKNGSLETDYLISGSGKTASVVGESSSIRQRPRFLDAQFNPTTSAPEYIQNFHSDGSDAIYSVETGRLVRYASALGEAWTRSELDEYLQVIRDASSDVIKQIWNYWDGLAQVEDVTASGYRIAFYLAADIEGKDEVSGLYTLKPGVAPFKTFTIVGDEQAGTVTITESASQGQDFLTLWTHPDGAWNITRGTGDEALVTERVRTAIDAKTWQLSVITRKGASGAPASSRLETWQKSLNGDRLVEMIDGYGSDLEQTTTYKYDNSSRVVKTTMPNGAVYETSYDAQGRVSARYEPTVYGDAKITYTGYADNHFYDSDVSWQRSVIVTNNKATQLERTDYTYATANHVKRTERRTKALGSSHTHLEVTEEWLGTAANRYARNRVKMTQSSEGIQTHYSYEPTALHGALYTVTAETQINGSAVPGQSTRRVRYVTPLGQTSREESYQLSDDGWVLLEGTDYEYNENNKWIKKTRSNRRVTERALTCCGGILWERDEDDVTISYAYDSARQLIETIRSAVMNGNIVITPEAITSYTRDATGRALQTRRDVGAMTAIESIEYDLLGRTIQRSDILGRVTAYQYSSDGLTETTTTPSGATLIETNHPDGSALHQHGTGQRELYYTYGIDNNLLVETTLLADGATILTRSSTNGFGQTVLQQTPSAIAGVLINDRSFYNAQGRLVKRVRESGGLSMAPTLYEYDSFGNILQETLALSDAPTVENSPITTYTYSIESREDGIYQITAVTRNNASGGAVTQSTAQLISASATLESKTTTIDVRGNESSSWTEYDGHSRRIQKSTSPASNITAQSVMIDGMITSQTDHSGISSAQTRAYTATGVISTQTDGRGNTTTVTTDIAGRTVSVTDAAGNTTMTAYAPCCDNPASVTDALGNATHYRYDIRGRKTAEWGASIQPACFSYDDTDRMIELTTYRADESDITDDPTGRSDGDTTAWQYHPAAGLEMVKTYADGTQHTRTYDALNNPATLTDARGIVTAFTYETARGLLLSETYSDHSAGRTYDYNILGNLTQVTDASGVRTVSYNNYNELVSEQLAVGGKTHLLTETLDQLGRHTGTTYTKDGSAAYTTFTGYAADGRLAQTGFLFGGAQKTFRYTYLANSSLLQTLSMPNNMSLTRQYEPHRDLVTAMNYKRGATGVIERGYGYDPLGRPVTRRTARQGSVRNDSFAYNTRSELTGAMLGNTTYGYDYDNIGNRKTAQEAAEELTYNANELNQYTSIATGEDTPFTPTYDANGNQTLIKTSTGIWSVAYDANNRPVTFTSTDSPTTIECAYDYLGRRCTKKVTVNSVITLHQRYIYRGHLQIAAIDLKSAAQTALWFLLWDPSEPTATRPLAIRKDGTWYCYGHDLTKNVCEVFGVNGYIRTVYDYSPYGAVTSNGDVTQPCQWSSEYHDSELALTYYNYRHYNPADGRWINRDPIQEQGGWNLYGFVGNNGINAWDYLGQEEVSWLTPDLLGQCFTTEVRITTTGAGLFGWATQRIIWEPDKKLENSVAGHSGAEIVAKWSDKEVNIPGKGKCSCETVRKTFFKELPFRVEIDMYFLRWSGAIEKYTWNMVYTFLGEKMPQEDNLVAGTAYGAPKGIAYGVVYLPITSHSYKSSKGLRIHIYVSNEKEYLNVDYFL